MRNEECGMRNVISAFGVISFHIPHSTFHILPSSTTRASTLSTTGSAIAA